MEQQKTSQCAGCKLHLDLVERICTHYRPIPGEPFHKLATEGISLSGATPSTAERVVTSFYF